MYRFIKEKRPGFEITPEEIQEIEERYGIQFPDALAKFYLEYNGAYVKLCYFEADEDEDDEYDDDEYEDDAEEEDDNFEYEYEEYPYEVRSMMPLRYGELTFEHVLANDRDYMDADMFPIASNQGGDYYYWDRNNEKVYLYYDDIENPIFICHTIKRFFEKLSDAAIQAENHEKNSDSR